MLMQVGSCANSSRAGQRTSCQMMSAEASALAGRAQQAEAASAALDGTLVYSLKPPQLSLLQRYLAIQDGRKASNHSPASNPLQKVETSSTSSHTDVAVQTASARALSPLRQAASVSPSTPKQTARLKNSAVQHGSPSFESEASLDNTPGPSEEPLQRLRLGRRPCRWTTRNAQALRHSPAAPRARSPDSHLSRTLDDPPEPLLGSPLASATSLFTRPSSPGVRGSGGNLESMSAWPLRLDSYYAPNMFDVIDSLESGSRIPSSHQKTSAPSAIAEELRRLQRDLVAIEHKVQKGSTLGSALEGTRMHSQADRFESPWLKAWQAGFQLEHSEPSDTEMDSGSEFWWKGEQWTSHDHES
ncbi:unnamed protein product [Effrenium voratum]|nr:unnamed protein product [Effrenium voratum]